MKIERLEMEGPRDDEVLVRLVASGICHTDIDLWRSGSSGALVLGHEGAGIVERAGEAVRSVRRGDHVVLSYQSCGQCRFCKRGQPTNCSHFWELNFGFARLDGSNALEAGGARGHFFGQSSFATYTLAIERNIVKVSKALPLQSLAPLGCGLQTGAGTVMNSLAVRAGSSIAIFGVGSVGLAAVMAARIVGARPIIAIDIRPKRLQLAKELGATHIINALRCDSGERIKAISGGVDYAVEATGVSSVESTALSVLNLGGRLALLTGGSSQDGLPGGRRVLSVIQGDATPQEFIPRLIKLWRKGQFPFERLIRHYDFRQINEAIADSIHGIAIKPVLRIAEP
jgi:aryl-alcohol dehydrogenase